MTDWIGETFTSRTGWAVLEGLADIGDRMAGTPGERAGLELVRDALADVGARDARLDEFDIQGWVRGGSRIEAGDEAATGQHRGLALPRSPAGSATGDLMDLGYGLPESFEHDVEGAVVMVASDVPEEYDRFVHRREKYYRAVDAGASAVLFRNHIEGSLPPTGSVGTAAAPLGEVPALGVSKEYGLRLSRQYNREPVTVTVECETPEATSANVHAEVGPETDVELLVTSHVDAHDISEGAMDNAAGTATVVEAAKALAAREADLETKVRFVCFGAEEVGLLGSAHEAAGVDPESVRAVLNVDSNVADRTLKFHTNGFDDLEAAAVRVAERLNQPIAIQEGPNAHSDHWNFVRRGVPGYMITADTGDDRGWGHTHADTLDKLEPRTLREQAVFVADLAADLARADVTVDHAEPEAIAADLEERDLAEGMRLTGDWPF